MRIIAGKYRGRKLVSFDADHIRPTTDRVKESLFNSIQFDLEDSRVLDLFAGTGNLSLESLSRGASSVTTVETNPKSIAIINKNKELLKVGSEMLLHKQDVFKFLKTYSGEPFGVILIDPPFTEKYGDRVMQELSKSGVYDRASLVAIETSKSEAFADTYEPFVIKKQKNFGDKILTIFEIKN